MQLVMSQTITMAISLHLKTTANYVKVREVILAWLRDKPGLKSSLLWRKRGRWDEHNEVVLAIIAVLMSNPVSAITVIPVPELLFSWGLDLLAIPLHGSGENVQTCASFCLLFHVSK